MSIATADGGKLSIWRLLFIAVCIGIGAAALILGLDAIAEYIAVAPNGVAWPLELVAMLYLIPLLAAIGLVISLVLVLMPSARREGLTAFVTGIVFLAVMFLVAPQIGQIRTNGFRKAAQNAKPLIAAIGAYEREHGAPPADLAGLVPEYLAAIPATGLGAYPAYDYEAKPQTAENNFGNSWLLAINASTGAVNWDLFLYLPKQNYPEHGYGGSLERVDDWAYVHE